jgi:hypothetical protein
VELTFVDLGICYLLLYSDGAGPAQDLGVALLDPAGWQQAAEAETQTERSKNDFRVQNT